MFRTVLVPIDCKHPSSWQRAVPQAIELARPACGKVIVMSVLRDIHAIFEGVHLALQLERMVAKVEEKIAQIVADYAAPDVTISSEVRCGSVTHEILAAAKAHAVDLIVMESHRPQLADYSIGPNAAQVVQRATCSVLVLRAEPGVTAMVTPD